jgi:hypothetical protein
MLYHELFSWHQNWMAFHCFLSVPPPILPLLLLSFPFFLSFFLVLQARSAAVHLPCTLPPPPLTSPLHMHPARLPQINRSMTLLYMPTSLVSSVFLLLRRTPYCHKRLFNKAASPFSQHQAPSCDVSRSNPLAVDMPARFLMTFHVVMAKSTLARIHIQCTVLYPYRGILPLGPSHSVMDKSTFVVSRSTLTLYYGFQTTAHLFGLRAKPV